MPKPQKKWSACGFLLADGTPCRVVCPEGEPCEHHATLADAADVTFSPSPAVDQALGVPGSAKTPRARLAEDATAGYESIKGAVFSAMDADKHFPVKCPACEKRFQAKAPDHTARLKAVELALSQGFGRPEVAAPPDEMTLEQVVSITPTDFSRSTLPSTAGRFAALSLACRTRPSNWPASMCVQRTPATTRGPRTGRLPEHGGSRS